MAPRCDVCSEENLENGHDLTQKHIKNMLLYQLEKNKKHFGENRNGIVVTSTVTPIICGAAPILEETDEAVLKVSVKPHEGLNFMFKIKNINENEDIIFRGITTPNANKFNFKLIHENLSFSDQRVKQRVEPGTQHSSLSSSSDVFKPKEEKIHIKSERNRPDHKDLNTSDEDDREEWSCLDEQVILSFENDIGVYKQPVYFVFENAEGDESTIILKEMLVFVEAEKKKHEKFESPYTAQPIKAERLERATSKAKGEDDIFKIPSKALKTVFRRNLKVDDEDVTEEEKAETNKVKAVFAEGPTQSNYIKFFHNLLWYEETAVKRNLKKYNMLGVPLSTSLSGKSYFLRVPGLAEKRPSLILGDLVFVRPHNQTEVIYEAIITDIQEDYAQFGKLTAGFHKTYTKQSRFDIRFCMTRLPSERMHAAVDVVRQEHMIPKVFPQGNERVPPVKPILNFYNPLVYNNPEQRAVVEHIVAGTSGTAPYLLNGPPGTGKTVTIVEAILQLARTPSNRILVCADSNKAADYVATLLVKSAGDDAKRENFLLRANSQFRPWDYYPSTLAPYSNGTTRDNWTSVSIAKFLAHSIVVTTLVHAAKFGNELKKKGHKRITTHVFIDEAAQASEPASLIPLCGLLPPGGALVLAGDPKQLGPVVISREAAKLGLGVSLMERLKRDCVLYSNERNDPNFTMMLRKNFRSHRDILSISDELFYHGQLQAMAPEDDISTVDIMGENKSCRAIVFNAVMSQEQREGKSPSFYNDSELQIVQQYILKLLEVHKVNEDDIGIVTPYIRQVYKMKKWLQSKGLGIEVGTVEAFQGKEKRIIIASTVRAKCELLAHDAKFGLGFLVDPKRFNVVLTRAKAKLIVVGNPACLQTDLKWRHYMAKCRELGTYRGTDLGAGADTEAIDQITEMLRLTRALENMSLSA